MAETRRVREQWRELTRHGKAYEQEQSAGRDRYLSELRAELTSVAPATGWHGWWARWVVIPGTLFARRTVVDDVGTHAGALTYASVLSIPPLLVFAASVAGLFLEGSPSAQKAVIDSISSLVPVDIQGSATDVLQSQMSAAISGKVSFGLVGLLGLLWSASGLSARLRHALGLIFGTARAGLWTGRVVGALLGLFVVVSLLGVAILSGLQTWAHGPWSDGFLGALGFQIAILAGQFVFILVVYRVFTPGRGPRFRDHLLGAAVFIVGFEALVLLGDLYFGAVVSKSSALFGALGGLFGVIAFLYATAWLLLMGGEVSAFRWEPRRRGRSGDGAGDGPPQVNLTNARDHGGE
jgi:membrane protein